MLIVSWFICGVLYFFLYSYLFCTMVCKEKFNINIKLLFLAIIMSSLQCIVMECGLGYIRPYLMHILSFIMLLILYKQKLIKTLLGLLIILALSFIAEFIFGTIGVLVFKIDFPVVNDNYIYYVLTNTLILVLCYLISRIGFVRNLTNHIMEWYNQNEYKSLMLFVFLILKAFKILFRLSS